MYRNKNKILPVLACLAVLLIAVPVFAQAAKGTRSTPQILGAEDSSKQITVTFWLALQDKAGLDALVRQMYDRNSPNYHQWLTPKQFEAKFAPTAAEAAIARQYLASHNLKVVGTDKFNHYLSARGTVADVQRATGVQLNRAVINGETHRMPSATPTLPGVMGKVVYAVQGLSDFGYKSHLKRAVDPDTGKMPFIPLSKISPLSKLGPAEKYFNANCLGAKQGREFTTDGTTPTAHYAGTRYGDSITLGPPSLPPCGYNTPQVDTAYGLTSLYSQKLDGTGETVVIVDAYGSDTITGDANIFSSINGLPALTSSNFAIYYPSGPTSCGGNTCGWDVETSLDVEWAHSVAPGANIALVLGLTNSLTDLDTARLYAIDNLLGPVMSNSYGIEEAYLATYDPPELTIEDDINQEGAAFGISSNFSSGDDGDFVAAYGEQTVSMPASSPYATAVGGTSLFLNANHTIKLQTGWGNNLTRITGYATVGDTGQPPLVPPLFEGFYAGAGGGTSAVWPEPTYQSNYGLVSSNRLVPDISMLADPFTPVEIVVSEGDPLTAEIGTVGGTSLACPTFSGIWAIATQDAGVWLGQAAPILYGLPSGAITDILAVNGPANVVGQIHVAQTPVEYFTAPELVPPLENTVDFVSTLYNGTSTRWYVLGFGLDSSLTTGPGWDNVTGLGTPNGAEFVSAVAATAPAP